MTASNTVAQQPGTLSAPLGRRILAGVIGGLAGGVVFGMLMAMMGMLPVIASMVGSTSPGIGFAMPLMISIVIGLGLTVLFGNRLLTGYGRGVLVGLAGLRCPLVGSRAAGDDAPDAGHARLYPGSDRAVVPDGAPDLRGYSGTHGRSCAQGSA